MSLLTVLLVVFLVLVALVVYSCLAVSGAVAESEDRHATGVWLPADEQGHSAPTVVCAWCDPPTVLSRGGPELSHDVCPACRARLTAAACDPDLPTTSAREVRDGTAPTPLDCETGGRVGTL